MGSYYFFFENFLLQNYAYKFKEFIRVVLLQKSLEEKNNTNPLFEFVLLAFGDTTEVRRRRGWRLP